MSPCIKSLTGLLLCCVIAAAASAQDTQADREAAVDRYLSVTPMSEMLEDLYVEMSAQMPPDQREAFVNHMRSVMRPDRLEAIARDVMLRTFTAAELNALADFYGSEHGSSAMQKFGAYMAEVLPAIQLEVQTAMMDLARQQQQQRQLQ